MDQFGTGLARPFRCAPGGLVTVTGPEKVLQSVQAVIGTPLGFIPWRCAFGTRIGRLRHRNRSNGLQQLARIDAADALNRWVPRFRLRGVAATPATEGTENRLDLTIGGEVVGRPGKIERVNTRV